MYSGGGVPNAQNQILYIIQVLGATSSVLYIMAGWGTPPTFVHYCWVGEGRGGGWGGCVCWRGVRGCEGHPLTPWRGVVRGRCVLVEVAVGVCVQEEEEDED